MGLKGAWLAEWVEHASLDLKVAYARARVPVCARVRAYACVSTRL